jgi:hypothetical protein
MCFVKVGVYRKQVKQRRWPNRGTCELISDYKLPSCREQVPCLKGVNL